MSMTGNSYPVARSTGRCAASGRAFEQGERYVATLVEREQEGVLERLDYGVEAWNQGARPAGPGRVFASWRSTFQEHPATKKPLLGDDELLDLFEQLGEATDPRQISFRYVLALLLVRRRLLRMVGSKPRTAERPAIMLVLPRGSVPEQSPVEVVDPGLDEAAIAEVIEQVGQILATGD